MRTFFLLLFSFLLLSPTYALHPDGTLLLSFKYAVLDDPLSVLSNWNYDDPSPCAWNGVICSGFPSDDNTLTPAPAPSSAAAAATTSSRVIGLVLPSAHLLGSLPHDLFLLPHLRHLDLSSNLLNGSLPSSLFSSPDLSVLSLAANELSGEIPLSPSPNLRLLNLSDNALTGQLPSNLSLLLPNLTALDLSSNYLAGPLPPLSPAADLHFLDLSSNLFNASLPPPPANLRYLNLSYNKLSGAISDNFSSALPPDATLDLSFNNLTGGIPQSPALLSQIPAAFAGNPDLCGKPLKNLCAIPSTLSNPPNESVASPPESPPAFAAIPKSTADGGGSRGAADDKEQGGGGFKPATIAAIVIGDLGGIGLLFVVFLYAYHIKKKKKKAASGLKAQKTAAQPPPPQPPGSPESKPCGGLACCLRKKDGDEAESSSEASSSSETEEAEAEKSSTKEGKNQPQAHQGATLVTVDGDVDLEMENLLKASAYILGAAGSTIVYKAVLADGTALAVRRIGESSAIDKLKDFDVAVRSIAKFKHPNLLRIWGFYWGADEKLLIHDYAPNGSLANVSFSKKLGSSSPFHLSWEARLRIARGVARGLAYIHDKKSVHGNLKPSNILLAADMEPRIGDFGLDRLLSSDASGKPGGSARLFGSKRSMQSQGSIPELSPAPGASPVSSSSFAAPYQAPEALKNLKPNAKWDVYSFGMVLLELISGRLFSEEELCQWNAGFVVEERNRIIRMADPAVRGEVEGREEALLSCFKLGFACAAIAPQRRPNMKDVAMVLDRIPSSASSSSSSLVQ